MNPWISLALVVSLTLYLLTRKPRRKTIIPFPTKEIPEKDQLLVVDCSCPFAATLTHHKGQNTPSDLKGDTSGDCVLNAIQKNSPLLNLPLLTTNHFDIDSLVSIFAAYTHPHDNTNQTTFIPLQDAIGLRRSLPLKHNQLLREVSKVGDFREFSPNSKLSIDALKVCCWINTVEAREFYRPFGGLESEGCKLKLDYFLPKFASVLENPDLFGADWKEEYNIVMKGIEQLKKSTIEKIPELGLVIIQTPEPIHYYALFSVTQGFDIVLSMYDRNRYELEFKYTTYVDLISRPTLPRIETTHLVKLMNQIETLKGREKREMLNPKDDQPEQDEPYIWKGPRITDSGPIMRLEENTSKPTKADLYAHPYLRSIYSSNIDPNEFKEIVKEYLKYAYNNVKPKSFWTWSEINQVNSSIEWDSWDPKI